MPKIQSAKKALRQNIKHRKLNLKKKTALKDAVREVKKLVSEKKFDGAKDALAKLYKVADKITKSNVINKNKAARIKSRMSKLIPKK